MTPAPITRTSLGCARCGACCDPVPFTREEHEAVTRWSTEATVNAPDPGTDDGWAHWLAIGWTEQQRETAIARLDPHGRWRRDADFIAAHWTPADAGESCACDAYDRATASCTAQDGKPPVCRGYPWYADGPSPERAAELVPRCSYLLDVGPSQRPVGARPLIPIEVITR